MNETKKVNRLRALMRAHHIDACYVGTSDPHNSEYLAPCFQTRAWLSGFTGSAGTAIVTKDDALLWADGRYYIQAASQIENTPFRLMKLGAPGVPDPLTWMSENLPKGARVSVNGSVFAEARAQEFEKKLQKNGIALVTDLDLAESLWEDRPGQPEGKIFPHPIEYTGRAARAKIEDIRKQMQKDGSNYALYVGLDNIAWLMNFRGSDIPDSALALAFALITENRALLFIDPKKADGTMMAFFEEQGIEIRPYHAVEKAFSDLPEGAIELSPDRVSRALYNAIPKRVQIIAKDEAPSLTKAVLNDTELKHQFEAGVRDSVAVTRFLYFMKYRAVALGLDEFSAAEELHNIRAKTKEFMIESFSTISAYGPNAAMMHYQATEEKKSPLHAKSLYLVDCGAQSLDGTTDITRTVALGPLTDEEKRDFTLTLKSHIALASLPFLDGTSGVALDAIARSVMWRHALDYKCGTGHGVGYLAGVHEGPQHLTPSAKYGDYRFRERIVVTIEPGVYREGKHGIRLENDYIVLKTNQSLETRGGHAEMLEQPEVLNEAGDRFLHFQPLIFVPFDRDAIVPEMLDEKEKAWLNDYNEAIRREVGPSLDDDERAYLWKETAPL